MLHVATMFPSKWIYGATLGAMGLLSVVSRRKRNSKRKNKQSTNPNDHSTTNNDKQWNDKPDESDSYWVTSRKRALQMIKHNVWEMKQDIDTQISFRTDLTQNQQKVLSLKWDEIQERFNSLKVTLTIDTDDIDDDNNNFIYNIGGISNDTIYEMLYNYFVFDMDETNSIYVDIKIISKSKPKNSQNMDSDDSIIGLLDSNHIYDDNEYVIESEQQETVDILLYIPLRTEYHKFIDTYCENNCYIKLGPRDDITMRIDDSMDCDDHKMRNIQMKAIKLLITGYVRLYDMDNGNKLYGDIVSLFMLYIMPQRDKYQHEYLDMDSYQDPYIIKWEMYLNDFVLKVFENSEIGKILSKEIVPNHNEIVFGLEDEY